MITMIAIIAPPAAPTKLLREYGSPAQARTRIGAQRARGSVRVLACCSACNEGHRSGACAQAAETLHGVWADLCMMLQVCVCTEAPGPLCETLEVSVVDDMALAELKISVRGHVMGLNQGTPALRANVTCLGVAAGYEDTTDD